MASKSQPLMSNDVNEQPFPPPRIHSEKILAPSSLILGFDAKDNVTNVVLIDLFNKYWVVNEQEDPKDGFLLSFK